MRAVLAVVRFAAACVAASLAVCIAGWSGASAALVRSPGDNSPVFWMWFAVLLVAVGLMPAAACVVLLRPAKAVGRLAMVCAVTWLAACVRVAVAGAGDPASALAWIGVMCAVTVIVLAHARLGRAGPPQR